MKTFELNNNPKTETGFTIPENYFNDFSVKMIQQLSKNESKKISIFLQKKTWLYTVAAVFVLALTTPIYTNLFRNSSGFEATTLENYITYQSTVSEIDLVNLLDKTDIQKIKIDLNIEYQLIENELLENNNLELYLLN